MSKRILTDWFQNTSQGTKGTSMETLLNVNDFTRGTIPIHIKFIRLWNQKFKAQ